MQVVGTTGPQMPENGRAFGLRQGTASVGRTQLFRHGMLLSASKHL